MATLKRRFPSPIWELASYTVSRRASLWVGVDGVAHLLYQCALLVEILASPRSAADVA